MPRHRIGNVHDASDRAGAPQYDRVDPDVDAQLGEVLMQERSDVPDHELQRRGTVTLHLATQAQADADHSTRARRDAWFALVGPDGLAGGDERCIL
jgi:hypothetical protein